MQARLLAHSELEIHSGRQFGAEPIKPCKHEHDGESPIALHSEFGPQGLGAHGFIGSCTGCSTKERKDLEIHFVKG